LLFLLFSDRIRTTRAAGVVDSQDASGGGGADEEFLGIEGEAFHFDQIPNSVEFVETSLTGVLDDNDSEEDDEKKEEEEDEERKKWKDGFKKVVMFTLKMKDE
jgi:hypothetical protein